MCQEEAEITLADVVNLSPRLPDAQSTASLELKLPDPLGESLVLPLPITLSWQDRAGAKVLKCCITITHTPLILSKEGPVLPYPNSFEVPPGPTRSPRAALGGNGQQRACTLPLLLLRSLPQRTLLPQALWEYCLAVCTCLHGKQLVRHKVQQQIPHYMDPTLLALTYLPRHTAGIHPQPWTSLQGSTLSSSLFHLSLGMITFPTSDLQLPSLSNIHCFFPWPIPLVTLHSTTLLFSSEQR